MDVELNNKEEEQASLVRTNRILTGVAILQFVAIVGLAIAYAMSRNSPAPAPTPTPPAPAAPFKPSFPCGVDCIKQEAARQGADVLTSVDNLKYAMDVVYSAEAGSGVACGEQHEFPAFKNLQLNPRAQLKLTTADTRERPDVYFQCTWGKFYHLVLNDALGGAFQNSSAYTHWLQFNMPCAYDSEYEKAGGGRDMKQGTQEIPGWFSGKGYLPPAFPYNAFHHFNFYLFETDAPFTEERLDEFDAKFPSNNVLGGSAWTIQEIMAELSLGDPVARTWMDVVTSYWSHLRMSGIHDAVKDMTFYKIICQCNLADAWPGRYQSGDSACNN